MPDYSNSLDVINPQAKEQFITAAMLLIYVLQKKKICQRSCRFSEDILALPFGISGS
jgi:hypothetical protein